MSALYRCTVLATVLLAGAFALSRQSGIQITPEGKRTLVSKDVGSERWAITLNTSCPPGTSCVAEGCEG